MIYIVYRDEEPSFYEVVEAKTKQEAIRKCVSYLNRGEGISKDLLYHYSEFSAFRVEEENPSRRTTSFCTLEVCGKNEKVHICCADCELFKNCKDSCERAELLDSTPCIYKVDVYKLDRIL